MDQRKCLVLLAFILFFSSSFAITYVQTYSCAPEMEEKLLAIFDDAFSVPGTSYSIPHPCVQVGESEYSVSITVGATITSARGNIFHSYFEAHTDPLISKTTIPSPLFLKKLVDYIESTPKYASYLPLFEEGGYEIYNPMSGNFFFLWHPSNIQDFPSLTIEPRPRSAISDDDHYAITEDYQILYLDESSPDLQSMPIFITIINEHPLPEAIPLEGRENPLPKDERGFLLAADNMPVVRGLFPFDWIVVGGLIIIAGIVIWIKKKR